VSSQVGVGNRLNGLLDDGGDNWSPGNWQWGNHWGSNHWGSLDLNSWGGSHVVWVVVVEGVVEVWVVESVVGVVVGAVGVWVVVTVVVVSLCVGLGFSLGGGLALGQSVRAEGQSGAASGSDAIVQVVGAELANDGWGGSSDNGWDGSGGSPDQRSVVEEWGVVEDWLLSSDHGGGDLDSGLSDHWGGGEGGQWGGGDVVQGWDAGVRVEEGSGKGVWQERSGGGGGEELSVGVTLVEAMMVVPGVSSVSVWIVSLAVASVVVGIVVSV